MSAILATELQQWVGIASSRGREAVVDVASLAMPPRRGRLYLVETPLGSAQVIALTDCIVAVSVSTPAAGDRQQPLHSGCSAYIGLAAEFRL
jgi:hypothetical protein